MTALKIPLSYFSHIYITCFQCRLTTADSAVVGSMYGGYGSSFGGMGGLGGMYSPFMSGGYGGYSPYNRLGAYGMNNTDTNSFVNQAEASAQGAFQSVESVVSAMSSISMMLESTYCALHNSFRAVLGVADQFSRLKVQLTNVATSFAIFRFLRWLYRRMLVLLRLRQAGLSEDAWANAWKKSAAEAQERFPTQHKSSWPLIVFMAITFGGPYLIWRMVSNIAGGGMCTTVSLFLPLLRCSCTCIFMLTDKLRCFKSEWQPFRFLWLYFCVWINVD